MDMVVLGITGQTGAGKTTLLDSVVSLGGQVIDCDALYWELLATDLKMRKEILEYFPEVISEKGEIDRKKLGEVVFSDELKLEILNGITHPVVLRKVDEIINIARKNGCQLVSIDAIALIESGLNSKCDRVIAVIASEPKRISRILKRDSISEEYAEKRVKAQKNEMFFRENADEVVENEFENKKLFLEYSIDFMRNLVYTISERKEKEKLS